jgi:hypothetical protein
MSKHKPRLRLHTDGQFDIWRSPARWGWKAGWHHCGFFAFQRRFLRRWHTGSTSPDKLQLTAPDARWYHRINIGFGPPLRGVVLGCTPTASSTSGRRAGNTAAFSPSSDPSCGGGARESTLAVRVQLTAHQFACKRDLNVNYFTSATRRRVFPIAKAWRLVRRRAEIP